MKRFDEEQIDKLERALARAHVAQDGPRFSHRWVESIMRDIRLHPIRIIALSEVPRLVWHAATVVAVISLIFVGSLLTWKVGRSNPDVSALLAEATVYPTLFTGEP